MNIKYWISFVFIFSLTINSFAQQWPVNATDNAYYNIISAIFGEIHSNHFHEGIDLFVGAGVEVVAIEDGIISYQTATKMMNIKSFFFACSAS